MPDDQTFPLTKAIAEDNAGDSYHEIEKPAFTKPPEPLFTYGPLPDHIRPALFAVSQVPGVGFYTMHNVQVSFDGILIRRGRVLHADDLNLPEAHAGAAIRHNVPAWRTMPARRIKGMAALLHGPGFDVYGHWLIDFLPRLWVLRRSGINIHNIPILMPRNLPGFAMNLLALCGIESAQYIFYDQKTELLAVETLIVPSIMRRGNRFNTRFPSATTYWRSLPGFANPAPAPHPKKLYVTRRHNSGNRHLHSHMMVESIARDMGYETVAPEDYPIPDQIALFANATHIAGEYGSGLHNTVFAPPGARICALRGTSHHPGFAQSGLAEVCGHQIAYLFGETPEHAHDQIFDIAPHMVAQALARLET